MSWLVNHSCMINGEILFRCATSRDLVLCAGLVWHFNGTESLWMLLITHVFSCYDNSKCLLWERSIETNKPLHHNTSFLGEMRTLWVPRNSKTAVKSQKMWLLFLSFVAQLQLQLKSLFLYSITKQHRLMFVNSQASTTLNVVHLTFQMENISCFITLLFTSVVL